ncbi:N(2)-fixation sustaining protein CowN [Psychromonas sp. KJ10-10]|uniref:N(2)-fixation sustaining protein CowN n=1 Tax=Psychromonas sp. KJ10-10 TaxID=3391823 RepID=UPI0039B36F82
MLQKSDNHNTVQLNSVSAESTDRYVSFCGLDCDLKADRLMEMLESNLNAGKGDQKWHVYFKDRIALQQKIKNDNLNFVGHQTNTLYEYFEQCADKEAQILLYDIEQNCC